MEYFRIKNWEKYQHRDAMRRTGPMLFIRLDVAALWDEKLHRLTPIQELTWYKLLLYSGQTRNKLEYNSIFLMRVLNLSRKPNLALFEELGLIEPWVASNLPATLPAVSTPRGEERRVDICATQASPQKPPDAGSEFDQVLQSIRKNGRKVVPKISEKGLSALKQIGGLQRIAEAGDKDVTWIRKEFVNHWEGLNEGSESGKKRLER